MKAVILVGGEGTRMRPITLHTPKPLLPIANVPFVERQIKWLASHGIAEVVLSLGYLPDAFEEYFHENPVEGVRIDYAHELKPLGTAGAIKYAAGECHEDFVVCNGDVLTDMNISELVAFHSKNNSTATIALTYVEDPSSFGVVPTKETGEVIAFVEKPPLETAPSHWINAGIYVLSPEFLELIPSDVNVSIERESFPKLLDGGKMFAKETDAYWLDIGTPIQYLRAHTDFLDNLQRFGKNDSLNEVFPNVYSDGEITMGQNVTVVSPSIVGAGTTIGDNCVLSAATLGRRCVINDAVTITHSVLLPGVHVDSQSRIDSSVIGDASDIAREVVLEEYTLVGAHEKIEPHSRLQGERVGSVV